MLGLSTGITNTSYQWQPNMVGADLDLWLRNGVGLDVKQWDDSSGNGNHATQETSGNQAGLDGGGLEFDGSDDHYDITNGIVCSAEEGFMVFAVVDLDDITNVVILGNDNSNFIEIQTNKRIRITIAGATARTCTFEDAVFLADTKMVLGIQREAGGTGNLNIYKNGSLLTPTSQVADAGAITFNVVGTRAADRFLNGHLYELLVYETIDLTASEINKISNYLNNKHNL